MDDQIGPDPYEKKLSPRERYWSCVLVLMMFWGLMVVAAIALLVIMPCALMTIAIAKDLGVAGQIFAGLSGAICFAVIFKQMKFVAPDFPDFFQMLNWLWDNRFADSMEIRIMSPVTRLRLKMLLIALCLLGICFSIAILEKSVSSG